MPEENKLLQFPAYVHGVRTLVDGGLKIDLHTQELTPEDAAILLGLRGKQGWAVIKDTKIKDKDLVALPEETTEFKGDKTPGQRLRAVIYKYWEQSFKEKEDFELFYRRQMGLFIEAIKEKLE